jgi:transposase
VLKEMRRGQKLTESNADSEPIVLPDPLPDTISECHHMLTRFWHRILDLEKQVRRHNRNLHGPTSARVDINDIKGEGKEVYDQTVKAIESERENCGQPPPPGHGGGGRNAPSSAKDEIIDKHRITDASLLLCPHCLIGCTEIGAKVSYQLGYIPARYQRTKHVQYSYGCPGCKEYVVTADKPLQPVDGGYPTAELIVHIVKSKFEYHLPLYRQEQIALSHTIPIARSTMSRWLKCTADELRILYDRMKQLILQCEVIESDETTMPFIRKGAGKTIKGKISLYRGDKYAPYNLYNFTEDGKGDNHTRFLPAYKGFLLTDGTAVYNGVLGNLDEQTEGATSANCWAHVYRYFEDAKKAEENLADYAIGVIKSIFKIEDFVMTLPEDDRVVLRQRMTKPLMDNFKRWLDQQSLSAAPTAFKDAVQYTRNRWPALCHFLNHGFLKIHNNDCENALRPVVLGRGNWLFMGSADGGQTAAILMTFIQTCRRLKIDSFEYLTDVLKRLPGTSISEIDQFLPDRWKAAREGKRLENQAA